MVPTSHTVTAFDEDMKFLSHKIAEMGGLAERMVENSIRALVKSDIPLAQKVITDDLILDERRKASNAASADAMLVDMSTSGEAAE